MAKASSDLAAAVMAAVLVAMFRWWRTRSAAGTIAAALWIFVYSLLGLLVGDWLTDRF